MERSHMNFRHFRRALLLLSPLGLLFDACRPVRGQEIQAATKRIVRTFHVDEVDADRNPRFFLFSP
jgi:hypothetical protein